MDISRYIGMFLAGTLMIIVALVLFPPLNGATDRLYTKFTDRCESANGTGFTKAYVGVGEFSGVNPTNQFETGSRDYSVGGGGAVTASVTGCQVASFTAGGITAALTAASIYNERGRVILSGAAVSDAGVVTAVTAADLAGYKWVRVPSLFEQFNSLNTTIISLLPVVVVAGYVILAGVGLARTTGGMREMGKTVLTSVGGLVSSVVLMYLLPVIVTFIVDAGSVVASGQYQVNNEFGSISTLLFSIMPTLLVVSIIGIYAGAGIVQAGGMKTLGGGRGGATRMMGA